jgi:hypothetical protein
MSWVMCEAPCFARSCAHAGYLPRLRFSLMPFHAFLIVSHADGSAAAPQKLIHTRCKYPLHAPSPTCTQPKKRGLGVRLPCLREKGGAEEKAYPCTRQFPEYTRAGGVPCPPMVPGVGRRGALPLPPALLCLGRSYRWQLAWRLWM